MARYKNTKFRKKSLFPRSNRIAYAYDTTLYPEIPESDNDLYLISTEGDRCDTLASKFYQSPHFWWIIAQTNNLNSMNIEKGTKLRIPNSAERAKGF